MHEVGVAEGILKTVMTAAKENDAASVTAIGLKIGALSGVEPRSLEFALDCLKADSIAKDAKIEIEIVSAVGECPECGKQSTPDTFFSVCEHCGALALEITAGKEFEITYVDVE